MSKLITGGPRIRLVDPIDPPLVPSIYDDEFESATLDPSWTRGGTGTFDDVNPIAPFTAFSGTGTRWSLNGSPSPGRRSWYMVQPDAAPANPQIRKPITFPSEYFVYARMSFPYLNAGQTNNDSNVRVGVIEPVSNDQIYLSLNESDANTVQVEFATIIGGTPVSVAVTNNVGGAGNTGGQAGHTVGIQCLSGTYHAWVLAAAGNWLWIASVTPGGVAPTHAFLPAANATTSPGNGILGFDFFRFKAGRFLP